MDTQAGAYDPRYAPTPQESARMKIGSEGLESRTVNRLSMADEAPKAAREFTARELIITRLREIEQEATGLHALLNALPSDLPATSYQADRALCSLLLRRPTR